MWHYLYFIVLIKVKDPTEFTGPESFVDSMVEVSVTILNENLYTNPFTRLYIIVEIEFGVVSSIESNVLGGE